MKQITWLAAGTLLCCSLNVLADNVTTKRIAPPKPAQISNRLVVIGNDIVREQWPTTLSLVNAPESRTTAVPGQCISIGIVATGDDRDALLKETAYNFEIEFAGKKQKFDRLHPIAIKRMKPEGGDFVMQALSAAQVGRSDLPDLSMASLAAFDVNWCVPKDARDGKATISGSALSPNGVALRFKETSLPVMSLEKAVTEGAFRTKEEFSEWFTGYYRKPNPARVLAACRFLANDNMAFALNVRTFLVEVLKSSPEVANDLQGRLVGEDSEVRGFALHLLDKAGYDITQVMARLPEKDRAFQEEFLRRVPPLVDPYDLQVDPAHFDTPARMDALWSIFLATGKPKPVRAIADVLMWRDDYPAIRDAQKTPGKHKAMTVALGRGVCYMTAGWSLGSFVRHDGLVADFVDSWKADPNTPKLLKEELDKLLVNEAFNRTK